MINIPKKERFRRLEASVGDEIMIREFFESGGYSVIKLDEDNKEKEPDYKMTKGNFKMYAEVKSIFNQSDFPKRTKAIELVRGIVNKEMLVGRALWLSEKIIDLDETNILKKAKAFRDALLQYLGENSLPTLGFRSKDGLFNIKPISDNIPEEHWINFRYGVLLTRGRNIKEAIKNSAKKFRKYKNENVPCIIVICGDDFFMDRLKIEGAMFGKDGSCQPNKNTTLSAIILFRTDIIEIIRNHHSAIPLPEDWPNV